MKDPEESEIEKLILDRKICSFFLRDLYKAGRTCREAEDIIEEENFDPFFLEPLRSLKERGELEHLIHYIFFPIKIRLY